MGDKADVKLRLVLEGRNGKASTGCCHSIASQNALVSLLLPATLFLHETPKAKATEPLFTTNSSAIPFSLWPCHLELVSLRMVSKGKALAVIWRVVFDDSVSGQNPQTCSTDQTTVNKSQLLTYEMAQKPHHIGVRKAWLTWHSQNLEEFRQSQPLMVVQDEIVRRFIRGFFPQNVVVSGNELVIKRRGNVLYVAGFLQHSARLDIRRIYWMFGFAEEFLSLLLKQPVKLELAFVESEADVAYNYI